MLDALSSDDKLTLLRFMCSFAWSDLHVSEPERGLIVRLISRLGLTGPEAELAHSWLAFPPREEDVDPQDIPLEHRKLFAEVALEIACADGELDRLEAESLAIFDMLVADGDAEERDEDDLDDTEETVQIAGRGNATPADS